MASRMLALDLEGVTDRAERARLLSEFEERVHEVEEFIKFSSWQTHHAIVGFQGTAVILFTYRFWHSENMPVNPSVLATTWADFQKKREERARAQASTKN